MGFWSTILKYGVKAAKGTGKGIGEAAQKTGKGVVSAGKVIKTAAVGGSVGYVGWEKLTTDKSIMRIVGDAVVGEKSTDQIAEVGQSVKEISRSAGDLLSAAGDGKNGVASGLDGISSALSELSKGGKGLFTGFYNNLIRGNVSGLSIVGLLGAAYLIFGRGGLLSKIAGGLLALMLLGNNYDDKQQQSLARPEAPSLKEEQEAPIRAFRR